MKATVAYNGSRFHGFVINPNVRTVAGELEQALATVVRSPVTVVCAGRTDKGVHGRGQVISFALPDEFTLDDKRLQRSLNTQCGPEIAVRDLEEVDEGFHARFSASWRRYRYRVWNDPVGNPLLVGRVWQIRKELDIDAMNEAAQLLLGEHDFASFCRRPKQVPGMPEHSLVRLVLDAEWSRDLEDRLLLTFEIRATSFCHQMVRSIVGTMIEVGLGRIEPSTMPEILAAQNRKAAGPVAPSWGLTFWDVGY